MKRTKSLVASILGTVVTSILVLLFFFSIITAIGLLPSNATNETEYAIWIMVIAFLVVIELFLIVALVLNSVTFGHINGSPEKYAKRKGVTITTIVFNFLVMLILVAYCFYAKGFLIAVLLISAATLIAANVLYIIDLTQEKERVEQFNKQQENPITEPVKVEAVKTEEVKVVAETTPETKEEK